jgi:predicted amidophosphoribosyltransferase
MDECQKCNAIADLYDGLCDQCMEQAHWDYQESGVF